MNQNPPEMSRRSDWFFGTIPKHWQAIPLKHLCKKVSIYGANIPAEEYQLEGVRFIRTSDIRDDGRLEEGGVFLPPHLVSDYILSGGDFLISRSGTVGRAYVHCSEHGICAYAGYLVRYVFHNPQTARWMFYITKSPYFRQWLGASAIEATIGNVNGEKYANLLVPIPPLSQQRKITDYLDRETACLDGLVAAKEQLLELLGEKRSSLITHSVTRGLDSNVILRDTGIPWLGKIPAHWGVTRLKFVAEVQGGLTLGKNYETRELVEFPYLRVANVQDGHIELSDVANIFVPRAEAESYLLQSGDVLMNEGGDADKLGRGSIWFGEITPCLHQNHVFAVRPKLISSEWLNIWTSTESAKGYFESRAKQSTNLASISATNIKELTIPVPPDNEQSAILAYIETEIAKIDALYSATERTISLLKERREALISAAVTGKIEVA